MDDLSFPQIELDAAWFDAIATRASRRRFDGRSVRADDLERVRSVCRRVSATEAGGVRAVVVDAAPDGLFKGLIGKYGAAIVGAPAFVAFVAGPNWHIDVGYAGEAVVLEATAAGIDTCWIAGSFDASVAGRRVDLLEGEQVRAVTPLGYGARDVRGGERFLNAVIRPRSRVDLERIAPGSDGWPEWARQAAQAARLAPSGKNLQPWRLRMDGDALVLSSTTERPYWTARIDCGIAALHAELGARRADVAGTWQRLAAPEVARFIPVA